MLIFLQKNHDIIQGFSLILTGFRQYVCLCVRVGGKREVILPIPPQNELLNSSP